MKKSKKKKELLGNIPTKTLLDEHFIARAIWECLKNNDPEGVMEVISLYLEAKVTQSNKNDPQTQRVLSALKHRNPTIKTLAKLMHTYASS